MSINFFDEHNIEGKDETSNIYLELVPENLTKSCLFQAQTKQAGTSSVLQPMCC